MRAALILLLLTAGTMLLATAAQELVADTLPQNAIEDASPAVEPQVLDDQPLLPDGVIGLGRRGGPATATTQRSGKPPGVIRPPPGLPDNKPPVGTPNGPNKPDFDDDKCIDDPDLFAREFVKGSVRSVCDNLIVRVERDIEGNLANPRHTKEFMVKTFIDARVKTVSFWSYGNNVEKYLRIGRTDMTLGNFVDNPPPAGLQNGKFAGIQTGKNFAGLLEAIGYSSTATDPKRPYFLVVTKKPSAQKAITYKPTWSNIVKYIQYFIQNTAAVDEGAYKVAGIDFATAKQYKEFTFDPTTTEILQKATFADLSGCLAECTYQDTTYGNITPDTLRNESWITPTVTGKRTNETACQLDPKKHAQYKDAVTRFELTEPTIIKEDDAAHCGETWNKFYKKFNDFSWTFTNFGQNLTSNRATALLMAKTYNEETNPLVKTIVLRTYLSQFPAGSFNALFSGDGYTYTGNGGFVGATGTEIHTGEIPSKGEVSRVFPTVRLVFFCIVNVDGNPYLNNICPDGVDDNFSTPPVPGGRTGIDAVKEYVNNTDWDIAEVN